MRLDGPGWRAGVVRGLRVLAWGLGGSSALVAAMVLPVYADLGISSLSLVLSYQSRKALALLAALLIGIWYQRGPSPGTAEPPWRAWLDAMSGWLLRWAIPVALAGTIATMLAAWVPHYLTWPWWADTDHFAVSALAWRRGILPYRDLLDYNFPGPTYLMWLLGVTSGWGQTWPFQAFDATWLAVFLIGLALWSRARFGGAVAGLTAGLFVTGFYLGLPVMEVGQRDWYTATLAVAAILVLQCRPEPGWRPRLLSAALMAAGLATRPYALLFVPAVTLAAAGGEGAPRDRRKRMLGWLAAFGGLAVLAFTPLMAFGIFDDFLRALMYLRPGGAYNRNSLGEFWSRLGSIRDYEGYLVASLLGLSVVVAWGPPRQRSASATWLLALLGALVYQPLSPVPHGYLRTPSAFLPLVILGFLLGVVLTWSALRPPVRLLAVGAVVAGFAYPLPKNCDFRACRRALFDRPGHYGGIAPPPGVQAMFEKDYPVPETYLWPDYQRLLAHLRATTTPESRVANALRRYPNPPLNGPTGRLSPFPHASGLLWLRWIGADREEEFIRALEDSADVVVWVPDESEPLPGLAAPWLEGVVRRRFRPEARFGPMEVWRRTPD